LVRVWKNQNMPKYMCGYIRITVAHQDV
jgi:hypothetical protein